MKNNFKNTMTYSLTFLEEKVPNQKNTKTNKQKLHRNKAKQNKKNKN